jgi:hypothetical protein
LSDGKEGEEGRQEDGEEGEEALTRDHAINSRGRPCGRPFLFRASRAKFDDCKTCQFKTRA